MKVFIPIISYVLFGYYRKESTLSICIGLLFVNLCFKNYKKVKLKLLKVAFGMNTGYKVLTPL
jgi:hypothetical protein